MILQTYSSSDCFFAWLSTTKKMLGREMKLFIKNYFGQPETIYKYNWILPFCARLIDGGF